MDVTYQTEYQPAETPHFRPKGHIGGSIVATWINAEWPVVGSLVPASIDRTLWIGKECDPIGERVQADRYWRHGRVAEYVDTNTYWVAYPLYGYMVAPDRSPGVREHIADGIYPQRVWAMQFSHVDRLTVVYRVLEYIGVVTAHLYYQMEQAMLSLVVVERKIPSSWAE
jgi:hypothetical protein